MNKKLICKVISCLLLVGIMYACYSTIKVTNLTVGKSELFKYEIRITTNREGRGSIHNPFDLTKYSVDGYEWIYTNSIRGKLLADSIIYTIRQRKLESPWRYVNLKGQICFSGDSISIDLYFYNRENPKEKDNPYEHNGKYKLNISNDPLPFTND
jgi:hypothetical protein